MARPRKLEEEILALRVQGLSYKEITEKLNCSKGTVAYHLGNGQKTKYGESSRRSRESRYAKYYKLKDNPCTDCGKTYPVTMMHFDHLGIEKKDGHLGQMMTKTSWADIEKEIAKCELVCIVCHGLRTIKRSIETGRASQMLIDSYNKYITECSAEAAR